MAFVSSFRKHFYLPFFSIFLCSVFVAILAGCQRADFSSLSSLATTSSGLKLEAFLPEDAQVAIRFGSSDQMQLQKFTQLLTNFPQAEIRKMTEKFVENLDQSLAPYQLTYGQNIKPFIGEYPQFFLAMQFPESFHNSGSPKKEMIGENAPEKRPSDGISTYSSSEAMPPLITAAIMLADPGKADVFFQKLVEKGDYRQENYKGALFYVPALLSQNGSSKNSPATFFARVQDVLVAANNNDLLRASIDRFESRTHTLLQNPRYQKVSAKITPALGVVYVDMKNAFGFLKKQIREASTPENKDLQKILESPASFQDALESETFTIVAKDEGLAIHGWVMGDEEAMRKNDIDFSSYQTIKPPYLYKQISADGAIFYGEGNNFKQAMENSFKIWDGTEAFRGIHTGARQFFGSIGLDFDQQILTMFDQGMSFVFKANDSIFPGFAFYTDVSSNPENAAAVMGKINTILQKLIVKFKPSLGEAASALGFEDVNLGKNSVHVLRLSLQKLLKDRLHGNTASVPPALPASDLEFWYGVADNKAFLAFQSGFDKDYGKKTLADDANFQATLQALIVSGGQQTDGKQATAEPLKSGFFYLSPISLFEYFHRIVTLVRSQSPDSASDSVVNDFFQSCFAPLKGAIFSASYPSKYEGNIDGFVLIQK